MVRLSGLFSVVILIVLGKLSGFLKDILITFFHGVSIVTDAYFLSNSISSVMFMAIYSAIPVLVVPLYTRLKIDGSNMRINHDLSSAILFFFTVSVGVAVFVFCMAQWLVDLFSGPIDDQVQAQAVNYLSIMALTFGFSALVSFFNAIQTVNKVVIPSYLVPIVNNSVFCVGLYFFSSAAEFDKILMLGVLAWLILLLFNYLISRKSFSFEGSAAFAFFFDRKFLLLFLPALIAIYVEQLNGFVGVYFASNLGIGSISVFAYANKLNMIFLSVFLVFLTASLFPRIAALAAHKDQAVLFRYLTSCIRLVVLFSIPVVIYMVFYAEEIVDILFKRGNFMIEDVVNVASVLSVVLIALPFCLVRDIMNRVFFSYGNISTPVLLSLGALLINASFSYVLYEQYGLIGLAASAVTSTIFNGLFVTFLVQKKIKCNLLAPFAKALVICGICGVFSYLSLLGFDNLLPDYWLISFAPFLIVYVFCLLVFRVREVDNLLRYVWRLYNEK